MEIMAKTGRDVYAFAVQHAMSGKRRAPRGRATRDAGFTTILLETPFDALPLDCGRACRPAIAAAEALQLIGAISVPGLLFRISPKFRQYVEPTNEEFHGAYGKRIGMQASSVVEKLDLDPSSRQAIITLWDPNQDNLPKRRDYPCTVAFGFEVEDGKLCMNTVMRSNDVWLGLPYDMFQFTQLQMSVARSLGLAYGWYRHTTFSLHVYDDDLDNARNVTAPVHPISQFQPMGIGEERELMPRIRQYARDLVRGLTDGRTMSEQWYANQLKPYFAAERRSEERRAANMG